MGLVKCYKCRNVVSSDAEECSICGANFTVDRKSPLKGLCLLAVLLALLYAVLYWV
jgi:uncharacterized Fe-S radical SAM superfamily protein PflX